ncbi:unnamed protein product [Linum tenue]|uniref:Uncharacterized protein n=1 Tax=Linum tenue TaxID=586396 RepID=A0AAV0NWD7_9ROSI|nr:unnamed protein product [Linum tenue]
MPTSDEAPLILALFPSSLLCISPNSPVPKGFHFPYIYVCGELVSKSGLKRQPAQVQIQSFGSPSLKIRAFLSPPAKKQSPPPSSSSSSSSSTSSSSSNTFAATIDSPRCYRRQIPRAPVAKPGWKFAPRHHAGRTYLIRYGNHWK